MNNKFLELDIFSALELSKDFPSIEELQRTEQELNKKFELLCIKRPEIIVRVMCSLSEIVLQKLQQVGETELQLAELLKEIGECQELFENVIDFLRKTSPMLQLQQLPPLVTVPSDSVLLDIDLDAVYTRTRFKKIFDFCRQYITYFDRLPQGFSCTTEELPKLMEAFVHDVSYVLFPIQLALYAQKDALSPEQLKNAVHESQERLANLLQEFFDSESANMLLPGEKVYTFLSKQFHILCNEYNLEPVNQKSEQEFLSRIVEYTLHTSRGLLTRILVNVLSNSQKAYESKQIPEKNRKIQLTFKIVQKSGIPYMEVQIRDWAGGFPNVVAKDSSFIPYTPQLRTTKWEGRISGTGVGLASLVAQMNKENSGFSMEMGTYVEDDTAGALTKIYFKLIPSTNLE